MRPLHYRATLDITPGQDSFTGHIQISVDLKSPSDHISLHAKELKLQAVSPAPHQIRNDENDIVTLIYDHPLPAGNVVLSIDYTGSISRILTDGAFAQRHAGDWYVFTKFEPITARRVFPCFDEPGFKVPWQLNLRVPADLKAFSNTPIESEQPSENGRKLVKFKETKPLPSYLVAFAVGPFDVVETAPVGRNHVPSRIVVPKGRAAEAEFAAASTPKLIDMLEDYFGTPYPYEKLDQVVVPLTTAWGAMENAGMIAYGDSLLSPKSQDSEFRHQRTSLTMEHEMSHQWFGDLVTMQWWNDLWLNEAFASWISSKLIANWHPEWHIAEQRAASPGVFREDSLTTARKIRQPIEAAGDIGGAFDGITYGKGQAVIAMFEHYLGEATFAKGVRQYLKAHAFSNATSDDLLSSLDEVAPKSQVGEALGIFLNQVGFPIVNVALDCTTSSTVRLTQQRMIPLGSTAKEDEIWDVPVCFSWSNGNQCVLLKKAAEEFPLRAKTCPTWLFADAGAAGYYATTYSQPPEKGFANLSIADKAAYARNGRLLFASGLGNLEQELRAATVSSDNNALLVGQSVAMLSSVAAWVPPDLHSAYAARIEKLYGEKARKLGWHSNTAEPLDVRSLRLQLLPFVATYGEDANLAKEARSLADGWLKDHNSLEADITPSVLYVAAYNGDRELFDAMVKNLRETKVQRERSWIISSLGGFRDPSIRQSALELIGSPGLDARETSVLLFNSSDQTRETVWKFVRANFDHLNAILPSARGVPFATRLPDTTAGFCDTEHADEVQAFFRPRLESLPGGARSLARNVEGIRLCAAKADASKSAVAEFLQPDDRIEKLLSELERVHHFGAVSISPDGTYSTWIEGDSLYLCKRGGNPIHVTNGTSVAWSPDSKYFSFVSKESGSPQIYISSPDGTPKQLTHAKGDIADLRWSPDGKQIAFLNIAGGGAGGPLAAVPVQTGVIGTGFENQRLLVVNVSDGESRAVTSTEINIYEYGWSPDSSKFAVTAAKGPADNNWWIAKLFTVDAKTGATTETYAPPAGQQISVPRWSPDGTRIGFIGGLMSDEGFLGGDIYAVDVETHAARDLTPNIKISPNGFRWLNNNEIFFTAFTDGEGALAKLDVKTGSFEMLWKGETALHEDGNNPNFAIADDAKNSAAVMSSWQQPPEVFSGVIGEWKKTTSANADAKPHWGKSESVVWTDNGFRLQGWLLYPENFDSAKKYPMVVSIHGGPAGVRTPTWPSVHFDMSALSSLGYFVFFPNARGSYGEGETFTQANVKDFGYGDLRDILSGVDAVLKQVPVDPNRIGVTGWSYGGYMTMWTVTQTNRFRAAVAGAGIANWQSYYGENSIDEWMIPYFGASVYDDPKIYEKSSPITFIKNVKTPTLVVVGERDGECPAPQSFEYWHALNTIGVPTQLVVYPGEGHSLRNVSNRIDVLRRTLAWFDHYLGSE